jgi:effector-binding domain-containing protein
VTVEIRTVDSSPTAVLIGPLDLSRLMPMYDAVYAFLRGGQTEVRQTGQNIAVYREGKTMEVGVEVDGPFEAVGEIVPSALPAGRVATATHTTGYGDMKRTYDAIEAFCRGNGHQTTGVWWEIYGDPDDDHHVDVEIYALLG